MPKKSILLSCSGWGRMRLNLAYVYTVRFYFYAVFGGVVVWVCLWVLLKLAVVYVRFQNGTIHGWVYGFS